MCWCVMFEASSNRRLLRALAFAMAELLEHVGQLERMVSKLARSGSTQNSDLRQRIHVSAWTSESLGRFWLNVTAYLM